MDIKQLTDAGFKFLGWMNGFEYKNGEVSSEAHPEYCRCRDLGHHIWVHRKGYTRTYWCDECKIVFTADSSD